MYLQQEAGTFSRMGPFQPTSPNVSHSCPCGPVFAAVPFQQIPHLLALQVVTAEDSGAPEVEFYYSYASQQIQRPPIRCVVFGESNIAVRDFSVSAHEIHHALH